MSNREVGIEDGRKKFGEYVIAAELRGEITIVTRYGRPAAAIVPIDLIPQEHAMTRQDLTTAVTTTLGDHPDTFDVDGIVEEIGSTYGWDIGSIDDVPSEEYRQIVERHDNKPAAAMHDRIRSAVEDYLNDGPSALDRTWRGMDNNLTLAVQQDAADRFYQEVHTSHVSREELPLSDDAAVVITREELDRMWVQANARAVIAALTGWLTENPGYDDQSRYAARQARAQLDRAQQALSVAGGQ